MYSKVTLIAGCVFLFTIIDDKCTVADNNFKLVPTLYEEIGCKEMKSADNKCTSYECPDFSKYDKNRCYINGKSFKVGEEIPEDDTPHCRAACRCDKRDEPTAHIECANIECPELFQQNRNWNCVDQYDDLKKCCRSSEICDESKIRGLNTCELDGKTYRIGERMYPANSNYNCLCSLDFNNQTSYADNSNCAKINCGIELRLLDIMNGCVPVYWDSPLGCPIEYKCPSKDDAIESQGTVDDGKTCKFGDFTLNRGGTLKTEDKCTKCECSIPPYLTCIKSSC